MATIFSTDKDVSTVKEVYFWYNQVKEIYFGDTKVWENSDALPIYDKVEDLPYFYREDKFVPVSTEYSPLAKSGYTSDFFYDGIWVLGVEVHYGTKNLYSNGKWAGSKRKYFISSGDYNSNGWMEIDGVKQAKTGDYYKYIIPENTDPYGKIYDISLVCVSGSIHIHEYQTSDEHALFGLSSDVFGTMNYFSARDYLTRSDSTYSVSQAGTLVFRPLKRCQINFSNTGYYFYDTSSRTISGLNSTLQNEKALTALPESLDDLLTDTFKNAGFETLPNNLILDTNTILLVGFLEEGTFWFSSVFAPDQTNITLNSAGETKAIKIYADDDVKWTASTSDSWITISKTSGTGESSVNIYGTKNTSGSSRIGSVTFVSGDMTFKVWVRQANYETSLSFGEVPATLNLSSSMSNTWEISETESHTTSGIELTQISFVPTKNGTVGLLSMSNFDIDSCDSTLIGATITQNNTSFDDAEAIAICNTDNSNTYGVIKGNTYYLQIYRADTLSTEFAIGVTLSFNAS